LLKTWLLSLPAIWHSGSAVLSTSVFLDQTFDGQEHELQALLSGLKEIKTEQALEHAFRQSRSLDQFIRQMHTWFDAFRTLKLIHFLRDLYLPSITYAKLKANLVYQNLLTQDSDLLAFHEHLRKTLATKAVGNG